MRDVSDSYFEYETKVGRIYSSQNEQTNSNGLVKIISNLKKFKHR